MEKHLQLGDTRIDIVRKRIKNIHLRVYPPDGAVRISAPSRMPMKTIREFALSKLGWIHKHQREIRGRACEGPRDYTTGKPLYVWGRRCLLQVEEHPERSGATLQHDAVILRVPPGSPTRLRHSIVQDWYRGLLKEAVPPLQEKWEPLVGAQAAEITVRRMKTRWGSCTPKRRTIRINLDLARKPLDCLEYIVVHELVHLLEPSHGPHFVAHMDRLMPEWRSRRDELKRLPLPHEDWGY